ncbi:MAG: ATP-binding cassette domain-containing protein [Lachnospiraceae bacterium]|nr:ATP-binding cassette domain-containing protein [Lachnospiraceae bacterium]
MIQLENVSKSFFIVKKAPGLGGSVKSLFVRNKETVEAVKKIDFTIADGEIVGLLGPNGAGKSTTIKMMTGILRCDHGRININGRDPFRERMKYTKDIGVVFGQRTQLWWELPVIESFDIIRKIYDVEMAEYNERLKLFDEMLGINQIIHKPVRNLSLGQRMLCDIAGAFLHNPRIAFLDEPTIGLDLNIKSKIRELILAMNKKFKTTIILTTHDISDIKALCERIIVIDKGSIIYDGNLSEISDLVGQNQEVGIYLENIENNQLLISAVQSEFAPDEVLDIDVREDYLNIRISNKITVSQLMGHILRNENIKDFTISEPDVEYVIRKVYAGELGNED